MVKIILEIGMIQYDEFLENLLRMVKEHPEMTGGMKLPPFSAQMIKMLPTDKKNEMMAQVINERKGELLPQISMMLARFLGPVEVMDVDIKTDARGINQVTAMAEISFRDFEYTISQIMPSYYSEYTAEQVFGAAYTGPYDLASAQNFIRMQDYKNKQFYVIKTMSVNRSMIIQSMHQAAARNSIQLHINNIRFLVR